ncbi:BolA family transcriptional regulator [Aliikangiella marina]|uniref:BolA family transcriptional regulator n=1 Tax=Aliikangiella marina TaxID=1712262 RepID=A0A545T309_9GAMM|nr:BolA family protein [Aliikangiella marina]TQV71596.1 BolA family transcriptional regulator [Aliikangiella marina]
MDNQYRIEQIQTILSETFQPSQLEVIDDSHLHAGHAGAKEGKGHFTVIIRSDDFKDLTRLKQHQAIYQALGSLMETDIHALAIKSSS